MNNPVRILILGTGGMANRHGEEFTAMDSVDVVAAVDLDADRLAEFQKAFDVPQGFTSLEDALEWGAFDAVSNVTPDGVHYKTTMALLAAGKHVLCEKPLATNAADAEAMAEAAAEAGVVNMVNLSYRNASALQHAAKLVADGEIGEVRHFEASYLQSWLVQPAWGEWDKESQWLWRLSTAHGSKGVLGDVGIHILDFATYVAGLPVREVSCRLATFDKAPDGKIGEYTLDANDSATMQLVLENGALGTVTATRFASGHLNDLFLRIHGTKGGLEVTWKADQSHLRTCLGANLEAAEWVEVECPEVPSIYASFVEAVRNGQSATPDFPRGAVLQRVLDAAETSASQQSISLPLDP